MQPRARHDVDLLGLWERAAGLDRWRRDEILLSAMHEAPPRGLGARNIALLTLRNAVFQGPWSVHSRCPACGEDCSFELDSAALARNLAHREPAPVVVAGDVGELRAPTVDDLAAVSGCGDRAAATRALLLRCMPQGQAVDAFDDTALAAWEQRLEQLDPAAVVSFLLDCPACGTGWPSPIDIGDAVWSELRHAAERALLDVDALARAYGWPEREILALSPVRRAAYLQLVQAS